jgi:cytochrome c oxidase subunit 3
MARSGEGHRAMWLHEALGFARTSSMGQTPSKTLTAPELANEIPERETLGYSGMVIFLGSWAMMFAALFFSYAVLRISAPVWPAPGFARLPLALPGINTLLLIASGRTSSLALARLKHGDLKRTRDGLLWTIALGAVFVACQCKVWKDLWNEGLHLDSGAYGGTFYLLTVFHILHVLVGLGLLMRLVAPLLRLEPVAPGRTPAALTGMFWHFVGAIWLVMFVAVYVL